MWTYTQTTGWLSKDGKNLYQGYSGANEGKNNPQMEATHNVGPVPVGLYTLGKPVDTPKHGPYFIPLIPDPKNIMFGRSAFGCHGDSVKAPGTASEGCIIMPRSAREMMWQSGDHLLEVVSGE